IIELTKYSKKTVLRLTEELNESYFISRDNKIVKQKDGIGGNKTFTFKLMPKGEEALSKSKPRRLGASMDILGEVIGASVFSVRNAVNIIKHGDTDIIEKCRDGRLNLSQANTLIFNNRGFNQKGIPKNVWGRGSKIKCPHCNHVSLKEEYTKLEV
ncbi:hypothetical protein LCGC14_1860510, partial [marine sediment metagenome]